MLHRIRDFLTRGEFRASSSTIEKFFPLPNSGGVLYAYGTGAPPNAVAGYAPGCVYTRTDGTGATLEYINTGSATSSTWKNASDFAAIGGVTIPTGQTLAITDADKLTVNGIIVPQFVHFVFHIPKIAADVIYNAFIAPRAMTVTRIDYVPRIAQGGAMTVTPVKATGASAPAAATTPLVSAAFDGNATADTVQNGALTATGADLALATGNRIGIVLSTASTVGQSDIIFTLKYS